MIIKNGTSEKTKPPSSNLWFIKPKLWAERHQTPQWSRGEQMMILCGFLAMNNPICFLFLSSSQSSDSSKKQKVEITTAPTETAGNGERHTGGLQWKCVIHLYHVCLKFRHVCHVLKNIEKINQSLQRAVGHLSHMILIQWGSGTAEGYLSPV